MNFCQLFNLSDSFRHKENNNKQTNKQTNKQDSFSLVKNSEFAYVQTCGEKQEAQFVSETLE